MSVPSSNVDCSLPFPDQLRILRPEISRLLNGYDVALVQEDWEYHELLTEHAVHRVVERGNDGERLLGVLPLFNGSGLTSLVRLEPDAVTQVTREAYGTCSGWLGGSNAPARG